MACGVTTTVNAVTVTCDNAGTSSHSGNHSGLLTLTGSLFGITFSWAAQRVQWSTTPATSARVAKHKAAVLGESDYT